MIPPEIPKCWHTVRLDKSLEDHNYLLESSDQVLTTVRSLNLSSEIKHLLLAMDWSKTKILIIDQVFLNERIGLESIDTVQSIVHLVSYRSPFMLPLSQLPHYERKSTKECLIIPIPSEFSLQSMQILKKTISVPNIVEYSELTELTQKKFSEFFEIMEKNQVVVKWITNESKERRRQAKTTVITPHYLPSSREHKFITAICAFERIVRGQQVA